MYFYTHLLHKLKHADNCASSTFFTHMNRIKVSIVFRGQRTRSQGSYASVCNFKSMQIPTFTFVLYIRKSILITPIGIKIIPGNTQELKVVPCQQTSGEPSIFPSKHQLNHPPVRCRGAKREVEARGVRGRESLACEHALARSLSFYYSLYLLTFKLN